MGLKKYEIITVGSDKRVRALRSWQVGDRYVNIGDVGGIVYDEKTLSQDGACWLFRGNFGFPGARIGGDSIVDVGEAALSATGAPNVDILGSSVVVGSKLQFASDQTGANALLLGVTNFEPGTLNFAAGSDWETWKQQSANYLRTKAPIFSGGVATTLKLDVPGYAVQAYVLDRDGKGVTATASTDTATASTDTGAGVTLSVPAGQYFMLTLAKTPMASIALSDVTRANITLTGTYETKLSIIDSRVEINPATSTGTATIKPGGTHSFGSGDKYPEAIIRNSKVVINGHATANRVFRLMGQVIGSTATPDATAGNVTIAGTYSNIKNLMTTGIVSTGIREVAYNSIQATDCDNFAVSPAIFPGLAAAQTANMPFIFQGCNVPGGVIYHHAQIKNTYKNIDFAKASADLGKAIASGEVLASSEVEGMYRLYSTTGSVFGALVEAHDSVKSLNMTGGAATYGTTIYKDAYFTGLFDIAGTNVFGNKVRSHPMAQVLNVQPRAVQGAVSTSAVGQTITGVISSNARVTIPTSLRVIGAVGLRVDNIPAGVEAAFVYVNPNNTVVVNSLWTASSLTVASAQLKEYAAYLIFRKADNVSPITPEDLAGVTVTVYNGCKIVNTGTTAVYMRGNVRVEDNAILVNASVTGSGYFGGNSVAYYNPTVWASLDFNGTVYMKDNAVFAPSALTGASALVRMEGNAKFIGSVDVASTNLSFIMRDNAAIEGKANTRSGVVMSGNSKVTATGQIMAASRGVLIMEDNASIEANTTVIGAITLSGNYKGNVVKTWTGKRTITDVNAPTYDNNVKTQYDF